MNSGLGPHAPPALALLMVNCRGQVSRAQTPLSPGHLVIRSRPAPFRPEDSEPGQRPGVGMETSGWAGTGEHPADRALRAHTLSPPSIRMSTHPTSSSCAHTCTRSSTPAGTTPACLSPPRAHTLCATRARSPKCAHLHTRARTHTHTHFWPLCALLHPSPTTGCAHMQVHPHPWPPCVYTLISTPSTVSQVPTKCVHTPSP